MLTRNIFPALQKTEILAKNPVSGTRNHTLVVLNNTSCARFYGNNVSAKTKGNYVFNSMNISGVRKCKY